MEKLCDQVNAYSEIRQLSIAILMPPHELVAVHRTTVQKKISLQSLSSDYIRTVARFNVNYRVGPKFGFFWTVVWLSIV